MHDGTSLIVRLRKVEGVKESRDEGIKSTEHRAQSRVQDVGMQLSRYMWWLGKGRGQMQGARCKMQDAGWKRAKCNRGVEGKAIGIIQ